MDLMIILNKYEDQETVEIGWVKQENYRKVTNTYVNKLF